ncbi:hypothetical protein [Vibrio sp. 1CM23M]|uniref:hypothetical protein n=1 Tax=Vibrio sp. 1CM23M TaxID=2929164 RepID=UPI0020BE5EFB|nr:hypothetical protein [Vibrio sp. 1CM23M]MCK8073973.1 hypothetical protein [Vibrio sp. 1CM23M]
MKTVFQFTDQQFTEFLNDKSANHKRKYISQRKFELKVIERGYDFHRDYEYINAQVRCKLICPFGHEYDALARSFTNKNVRCSSCSGNNASKAKQEFEAEVLRRCYTFSVNYEYTNARTKVELLCPKGSLYAVAPDTFKNQGTNCPCCLENNLFWVKAKDDFEISVKERGFTLGKGHKYKVATEPVDLICRDGHQFHITPSYFKSNQLECPICKKELYKNDFERLVVERGYVFHPEYLFINGTTVVQLICPKGSDYSVAPAVFKTLKFGCPCCDGQDKALAKKAFEQEVSNRDYLFSANYEYVNARTKVDLICPKGTPYSVAPDTFKNQNVNCPCCNEGRQPDLLVKEAFEILVVERGYSFHPDYVYVDANTKVMLICPNGTDYQVDTRNFKNGKGCLCCIGRMPIQQRKAFEEKAIEKGYSFAATYEYIDSKTRADLICPKGTPYKAQPTNFKHSGNGCPCCAEIGFLPDKEGYLYLQELWLDDELHAYKFGITNRDPEKRMKEHQRGSKLTHVLLTKGVYSKVGQVVLDLENQIKKSVKAKYVSSSIMEDGWTETIHPKYLSEVLDIIDKFRY